MRFLLRVLTGEPESHFVESAGDWFDEAVVGEAKSRAADEHALRSALESLKGGDVRVVAVGKARALWLSERAFDMIASSGEATEWVASCFERGVDGSSRDLLVEERGSWPQRLSQPNGFRETAPARSVEAGRRVIASLTRAWQRRRTSAIQFVIAVKMRCLAAPRKRQLTIVDVNDLRHVSYRDVGLCLVYATPTTIGLLSAQIIDMRPPGDRSILLQAENRALRQRCAQLERDALARRDVLDALDVLFAESAAAANAACAASLAERDRCLKLNDALRQRCGNMDAQILDLTETIETLESRAVHARRLDRSRASLVAHGFDKLDKEDDSDSEKVDNDRHDGEAVIKETSLNEDQAARQSAESGNSSFSLGRGPLKDCNRRDSLAEYRSACNKLELDMPTPLYSSSSSVCPMPNKVPTKAVARWSLPAISQSFRTFTFSS